MHLRTFCRIIIQFFSFSPRKSEIAEGKVHEEQIISCKGCDRSIDSGVTYKFCIACGGVYYCVDCFAIKELDHEMESGKTFFISNIGLIMSIGTHR